MIEDDIADGDLAVSEVMPTDAVKAERVGFEPTVPVKVHWFSRPRRSTLILGW